MWLSVDPATGRANGITGTPVAADPYVNGLRYQNAAPGALYCQSGFAAPTNSPMLGGIARDAQGVAYVLLEQLPPTAYYNDGGVLTDQFGTIYGTLTNPVAGYAGGGVPVDNAGRICFTPAGFGPVAMFNAPLLTTLVPLTAGDPSFTFTRATTAYVADHEGILRQAVADEARFQGARRVRNLIAQGSSENFSIWNIDATATVTGGQVDPLGGTTAYRLDNVNASSGITGAQNDLGSTRCYSVWMRGAVGGELIEFGYAGTFTLTTAWQRMSLLESKPFADNFFRIRSNAANKSIFLWRAQSEDVTGAANQAPGDYVSVGVLAAPYHGCGIDGCKYFSTTNNNSVAANVVTEAAGSAIPAATLLGYIAENQSQNLAERSQELDDAGKWQKTNVTVTANAVTAPDGTLTADRITGSVDFYTQLEYLGVLSSGIRFTLSVYVKAGTATYGTINNAEGLRAIFNATTGASSGWEGTQGTAVFSSAVLANGWIRVSLSWTSGAGGANWGFGLTMSPASGNGTNSGKTITFWGAQLEQASDASSYIPTTTGAATTRIDDDLHYNVVSNIDSTLCTAYTECYLPAAAPNDWQAPIFWTIGGSGFINYFATAAKQLYFGGALTTNSRVLGAVNKSACAVSGATTSCCLNGNAIAAGTPGAFSNSGTLSVGGAGSNSIRGSIRNVRFYATRLTDAQLQAMTAPDVTPAYALINTTHVYNGSPSTTAALPALSLTTGSSIFVHVVGISAATTTVSDTAGNVYTPLTRASEGGTPSGSQWFYKLNAAGNAANVVTATFSVSTAEKWVTSLQFSKSGALFDVEATASAFGTSVTSGSFSTSAAGLLLAGRSVPVFQTATSFNQGITWVDATPHNAYNIGSVGYRITTGALGPITVTETGNSSANRTMGIACFK